MKVSVNTVRQYINAEVPETGELTRLINAQLGQIEEVIELGPKYKDATIVKVVECEKHPNADRLSVCKIDDGSGELTQVVCGAPNVHAGMWAIWLPPQSIVPNTYGTDDEFTLGSRELRGVMSNGMLASGAELDISSNHEGIIEITDTDTPEGASIAAGASFSEVFGLDDTIIDIENKMFTHRPDLFGQLGVARELSAILGGAPKDSIDSADTAFESPRWYREAPNFESGDSTLELKVFNDIPEQSPRFMAVALDGVTVGPSPLWLQCELVRWGSKSINNIVDITNYIMLLTAQPVHAYDYDKLRGSTLGVRFAKKGETVTLLNDKTYELDETDIVIADGSGAVGLAGIMGGGNSEVSSETTRIVLEVATFDMYAVRRTSMRHGLFTDALTRYNKGQSPLQNDRVLQRLIELMPATQASQVADVPAITASKDSIHEAVQVSGAFINERLGTEFTDNQIIELLERVNMTATVDSDGSLRITAPFWRTDIELPEDIVEEVGRLYGYDNVPRVLPLRSTKPTPTNAFRELAWDIRDGLSRAGAHEVLTYSFVHERVLRAAGQDPQDAYRLENALSPDLQFYRLSLTPSLLDKVHANIKAGHDEFALFEIGKSHSKKAGLNDEGLPVEPGRIALVYAAKTQKEGAPYYRAKRLLEYLAAQLGLSLEYKPLPAGSSLTAAAPFADGRSARVIDVESGQAIGIIGEYAMPVRKGFKLPEYAAGFELFTEGVLLAQAAASSNYQPLSRYPSVERDICFEVAATVPYSELYSAVDTQLADEVISHEVTPIDIYQVSDDKKRITVRVTLTSYESTLTSDAVNGIVDTMTSTVSDELQAVII